MVGWNHRRFKPVFPKGPEPDYVTIVCIVRAPLSSSGTLEVTCYPVGLAQPLLYSSRLGRLGGLGPTCPNPLQPRRLCAPCLVPQPLLGTRTCMGMYWYTVFTVRINFD